MSPPERLRVDQAMRTGANSLVVRGAASERHWGRRRPGQCTAFTLLVSLDSTNSDRINRVLGPHFSCSDPTGASPPLRGDECEDAAINAGSRNDHGLSYSNTVCSQTSQAFSPQGPLAGIRLKSSSLHSLLLPSRSPPGLLMATDFSPDLSPSASRDLVDDAELRRLLLLLKRCFERIVVAHSNGHVIWLSDSTARDASLRLPMALRLVEAPTSEAGQPPLAELVADGSPAPGPGVQEAGPTPSPFKTFTIGRQSGAPLVVGVASARSGPVPGPSSLQTSDGTMLAPVFETWGAGVLALDGAGGLSYANPAAAELLRLGRDGLVGRPIAFLTQRCHELAKSLIALSAVAPGPGQEPEPAPMAVELEDGRVSHLQVEAQTVAGRWVIILRDVTAQVAARRSLERKNSDLEGYVQGVSHDLRSPLVSLVGFSRLLRQDYGDRLEETGRHFADRIEQAADTMRVLLDDLLEISRSQNSHEPRSMTDPRPILDQLKAELKLRLEEIEATLSIPAAPPWIYSDRARLYQIFSNLVGNAVQHMGNCGNRIIEVEIEDHQNGSLISVSDQGQGIPEDELNRVFQPFYSEGQSHRAGSAKGVGLNIVQKIAEAHDGRAWAENQDCGGARLHVFLPHPH